MNAYGSQAMSSGLKRVLMRRPGSSLADADPAEWHYGPTFDKTRQAMEDAGCAVDTFLADALCIACESRPPCLTRPVLRRDP